VQDATERLFYQAPVPEGLAPLANGTALAVRWRRRGLFRRPLVLDATPFGPGAVR
jgi:hypothetical protein